MDAQDGLIGLGTDKKTRRDHDAIVYRLAVDVLYSVDALDDGLKRFGDELDRIRRFETVGVDANVDHGNADLRLFLARNGQERDEPNRKRRKEEQRGQW